MYRTLRRLPWICAFLPVLAYSADAPLSLALTGLYTDLPRHQVARENLAYEPQYPLWSDGAEKRRWISLPAGSQINTQDPNAWEFPVGTKLWKEFSFNVTPLAGPRRIETRYLEKTADGWMFATYLWNSDETEALRAPEDGIDAYIPLRPGYSYRIPGTYECMSCHQGGKDPVIGFSALQLSGARDVPPSDPTSVNLPRLADLHLLSQPVTTSPAIPSASRIERQAIGYLHGNCASCHRPGGAAAFSGMHLYVDVTATSLATLSIFRTAVGRASNFLIPGFEDSTQRIMPRRPEQSSVFYRLSSEMGGEQMPPFGRATRDPSALQLLRSWMNDL